LAAGISQTYFVAETVVGGTPVDARGVKAWGGALSGFLGYDIAVSPAIVLGVGAELNDGGATARFESGADFASITPQWGYTLTARAGYAVSDALMLYGRGGYIAHRYSRATTIPAFFDDFPTWNRSFGLAVGVEGRLMDRVGIRFEAMHLDGTRNQFMLGVPIRF
jgi:outer membrane immunogenic protein